MKPEEEATYVPPYVQVVMPPGLDEDAALEIAMRESQQALEEDAMKEEARWEGMAQALYESAALAGLPPADLWAAATASSAHPYGAATTTPGMAMGSVEVVRPRPGGVEDLSFLNLSFFKL